MPDPSELLANALREISAIAGSTILAVQEARREEMREGPRAKPTRSVAEIVQILADDAAINSGLNSIVLLRREGFSWLADHLEELAAAHAREASQPLPDASAVARVVEAAENVEHADRKALGSTHAELEVMLDQLRKSLDALRALKETSGHKATCSRVAGMPLPSFVYVTTGRCTECGGVLEREKMARKGAK